MGMYQCHMDTSSWKLFGENSALAACPRDLSAQEASPDIDMFSIALLLEHGHGHMM